MHAANVTGQAGSLSCDISDGAVLLWHYSPSSAAPDIFGGDGGEAGSSEKAEEEEEEASENWVLLRALRGHLQDVIGIDFAPCSNFLISCSIDNTAIVFDVNKGTKLKMLSEHKGWVNGVSWDPRQLLIASIASDRWDIRIN
jgi:WD40 repeat protein